MRPREVPAWQRRRLRLAARSATWARRARAAPAQEASVEITADDLRQMARALGLVEVTEHLMPKVLEHVRAHRKSMRTFDASGIDLAGVVTAQPFRA